MQGLDFQIPDGASQHIAGAYLCLHQVPQDALVESRDTSEIEQGKIIKRNLNHSLTPVKT